MLCPLCGVQLAENATACDRCDWTAEGAASPDDTRDKAAAVLSVVPGLGHLYKGHIFFGGLIFFLIGPTILALSLAVLPATLGVSLIIPIGFMLAVGMHAYRAKDRRLVVPGEIRAMEGAAVHTADRT